MISLIEHKTMEKKSMRKALAIIMSLILLHLHACSALPPLSVEKTSLVVTRRTQPIRKLMMQYMASRSANLQRSKAKAILSGKLAKESLRKVPPSKSNPIQN